MTEKEIEEIRELSTVMMSLELHLNSMMGHINRMAETLSNVRTRLFKLGLAHDLEQKKTSLKD